MKLVDYVNTSDNLLSLNLLVCYGHSRESGEQKTWLHRKAPREKIACYVVTARIEMGSKAGMFLFATLGNSGNAQRLSAISKKQVSAAACVHLEALVHKAVEYL